MEEELVPRDTGLASDDGGELRPAAACAELAWVADIALSGKAPITPAIQ